MNGFSINKDLMMNEDYTAADKQVSGDLMLDQFVGNIPVGALSTILHTYLIQACSSGTPSPFKGGYFSQIIVQGLPILSCLHVLANNPAVTVAERTAFAQIHEALAAGMEKEERGDVVSKEDRTTTFNVSHQLVFLFQEDKKARAKAQFSQHAVLARYNGDLLDEPAMLLHFTREVLIQGVNQLSYLGGLFTNKVGAGTDVLVALNMFRLNSLVPEADKLVFVDALEGAKKLRAAQLEGLKTRLPFWANHKDARGWLAPVASLFDADAEKRGLGRGEWHVVTILSQVYPDKIVQECLWQCRQRFGAPQPGGFYDEASSYQARCGGMAVGDGSELEGNQ